ncbi:MAG: NAD(P)/FAD-dependent oxidoreductase, partial [Acidimicrobiales bacterium]
LARHGRRVTVVDRARFPRDKCCGDGLTTGALRRYESLGLDPAAVGSWQPIVDAVLRAPDGRRAELALPADGGQYVAAARRIDLDAAFLDVARRAGAQVIEDDAVTTVEPHQRGAGVTLGLAGGTRLRAWYAVAADGMWSPLRKSLGVDQSGYLGEWHAARQYLHEVGPAGRAMWVWFEPDLLPGYVWSFPLPDNQANVGYGILRLPGQAAGSAKRVLDELLSRPHITTVLGPSARPEGPLKAWPIPARIATVTQSALGGRVLFAGDAARACDPMTGEGIAQALETGELAGQVIARAGAHNPGQAAGSYVRQLRAGMAFDDRLARSLSKVLAHRSGANASVRIAATTDWTRRNFARWMFEDYPRALLVTPHRWRRGMLHQPGAYRR